MNIYHVTYYYLATGMEGHADTADYGLVEASSAEDASNIVGKRISPKECNETYRNWGLSARLVRADPSTINEL